MFVKVKRFLKEEYSIKEVDGIFEFTGPGELEAGQYVDAAGTLYRVCRVNAYYQQEDITSCEMERVEPEYGLGPIHETIRLWNLLQSILRRFT